MIGGITEVRVTTVDVLEPCESVITVVLVPSGIVIVATEVETVSLLMLELLLSDDG